ncbi:EamA-like transporter family [Candidatus Hepatincola sp. Pdp]
MLNYLIYAIILNTLDKLMSKQGLKHISDKNFVFFYQVVSVVIIYGYILFAKISFYSLNLFISLILLASILCWALFSILYFRALSLIDLSTYTVLSRLTLVWSSVIGIIFFKEKLHSFHLIGIVLIMSANLLYLHQAKFNKQGVIYIVGSTLCLSCALALDKYLTSFINPIIIVFFGFLGTSIICSLRVKLKEIFPLNFKYLYAVLASLMGTLGYICLLTSLSLGDISKILPMFQGSTILYTLLGFLVFKEFKEWKLKLASGIIAIIGVVIIGVYHDTY